MTDPNPEERDAMSAEMNQEVDAGWVAPGSTLYEVTHTHGHRTLKAGDLVRMVEDPTCRNLLLRTDWTLHLLTGEQDQYVHLRPVPMEALHLDHRPAGSGAS